jgi:hypothetical protein
MAARDNELKASRPVSEEGKGREAALKRRARGKDMVVSQE